MLAGSRPGEGFAAAVRRDRFTAAVTRTWPADALRADALSSHFSEEVRARCRTAPGGARATRGRPTQSPLEFYEAHPGAAPPGAAPYARHDRLYAALTRAGLAWCNFYNPAFALWLCRRLGRELGKPPDRLRILDPSAGWGDRALAACAYGAAAYHGYDPNQELQPSYKAIFKEFAPPGRAADFWVAPQPFEQGDPDLAASPSRPGRQPRGGRLADGTYDLVHTSPPFYDHEDYPAEGGAAARARPTYAEWWKEFFVPYLRAAWAGVRPGGFLVLYISDYPGPSGRVPLAADTCRHFRHLADCREHAVYGFAYRPAGARSPPRYRPAFVWKKLGHA